MGNEYYTLNSALFFWFIALLFWLFYQSTLAVIFGILSIEGFIVFFFKEKLSFLKGKYSHATDDNDINTQMEKEFPGKMTDRTNIGKDVIFEGNLFSNGMISIHGNMHGNINSLGGRVEILNGGNVKGNIRCHELIISGTIKGNFITDVLEIKKGGSVIGTVRYQELIIETGGILSGQVTPISDANHVISVSYMQS